MPAEVPQPGGFVPLGVALPDGGHLEVRALGTDDLGRLVALYDALDDEDRRLRFFSAFPPAEAFIRRWLDPARGCVLGAFVVPAPGGSAAEHPGGAPEGDRVGDDADGELVAEAGYALLANGNGELGITTAAGWRGWLGPFLLDVLAGAAHEAGVQNLEAVVRLDNRPMLGLISHRGSAVVEQPSRGEIRLVMATGARVPGWPSRRDPARTRVLLESPGGRWSVGPERAGPVGSSGPASRAGALGQAGQDDRMVQEAPGGAAGLEVLSCPGPHGRPRGRCPLLDGGHCPLVDGADEIVVVTDGTDTPDDGGFAALAAAHRRRVDGVPVQVCGLSGGVAEALRTIAARTGPVAEAGTAPASGRNPAAGDAPEVGTDAADDVGPADLSPDGG